jgi:NADH:ubiquinone oxidoreductase subunit F (NADH-binding)
MIQTAPVPPAATRLLRGFRESRVSLADHRSHYLQPSAPTTQPRRELIAVIEASGLRGRGGAGFPTARKLQAVADQPGRRIVVANGTEGEPASLKDTTLMRVQPHLILDGAVSAASAVGAERIVIAVSRRQREALASIHAALAERTHEGVPCPIELVETPPRYIAGEETALVHWLNGGPAKPTSTPPRPFERWHQRPPDARPKRRDSSPSHPDRHARR